MNTIASNECHNCSAIFQKQDRFCGNCGQKLFSLVWKFIEPTYNKTETNEVLLERSKNDVIIAVSDDNSVQIELIAENNGRIPLAICIPEVPKTELCIPKWVKQESILEYKEKVFTIFPGNRHSFRFKIHTDILSDVMSELESNPDNNQQKNKCIIPVYTSIVQENQNKQFLTEVNRLLMSPARAPYVTPNTCIVRFLSWEQLENIHNKKDSYFPVSFEVHNHQNNAIEIENISFEDELSTERSELGITFPVSPSKIKQLSFIRSQELFDDFMSEKIVIPSRSTKTIQLKLHPQLDILLENLEEVIEDLSSARRKVKKRPLRRFSSLVCLHAKTLNSVEEQTGHQEEEKPITFNVAGLIGHAPSFHLGEQEEVMSQIVVEGTELTSHKTIAFRNFGHVPIMIHGVEILKDHSSIPDKKEKIEGADWLKYKDEKGKEGSLYKEMIIPPFSKGHFNLEFDPNNRANEDLTRSVQKRYFRIHHSNCYSPSEQKITHITQLEIEAKLGTVYNGDNLVLAIDFGTTNSVAYLSKPLRDIGNKKDCIIIPLEGELLNTNNKTTLPSLLLYDSENEQGHKYITGTLAENQSALNPDNFVRSVKSVLNKNSNEKFYFMKKKGPNKELVEQTAQELLNAFILDVKTRAELEFSRHDLHEKLGFAETHAKLKRAVFTHPVDISDESKEALIKASHYAGLNLEYSSLDDFEQKSLLDESSAALISFYQFLLDSGEYKRRRETFFQQKVMCIDIGGGTTDISAASFQGTNLGNAQLQVENPIGFLFGGDDVDRMISDYWIQKYSFSSSDINICETVWNSYSYSDYERRFSHKLSKKLSTTEKRTIIRNNFDTAHQIRKIAEQAKIALADASQIRFQEDIKTFDKKDLELTLTQEDFKNILKPQLNRIHEHVDILLDRLSWSYEDLTYVVFTGQTNRIYEIQRFMRPYFNEKITTFFGCFGENPFEPKNCVAEGAALKNTEKVKLLFPRDRNILECNIWTNATSAQYGDPAILPINTPLPTSIPVQNYSGTKFHLFTDNGVIFMEFNIPEGISNFSVQFNTMSDIVIN